MEWAVLTPLLVGVWHALEADHVVTVSTLVSEERRLGPAVGLGLVWGLGHLVPVAAVGMPLLLVRQQLPAGAERVAEGLVGLLLVLFGVRALWWARQAARPGGAPGVPPEGAAEPRPGVPRRVLLTFATGVAHGLAGTGGAVAMAVAVAPSVGAGAAYLTAFGLGNVLGMAAATALMALPALAARRLHRRAELALRGAVGMASIALGMRVWRGLL